MSSFTLYLLQLRFVNKIFIWILLDFYLTYNLACFVIEYSRKLGSVRVQADT